MTPCALCHPLESNQNLSGFNRARRPSTQEWHHEAWVRLVTVVFGFQSPVCTVSLAFHCELSLGKPSIHLCCSRLQFGLRGSNSHFQSQSLVFCRLNETRSLESVQHVVGELRIELRWAYGHVGYGHARSHACLLARNVESPPRFFLRRAPKSLWLYVNQPFLCVGSPPGGRLHALATFDRRELQREGRTRGGGRVGIGGMIVDGPHPARAPWRAPVD